MTTTTTPSIATTPSTTTATITHGTIVATVKFDIAAST